MTQIQAMRGAVRTPTKGLSKMAALQAELETSMQERAEALAAMEKLRTKEREAHRAEVEAREALDKMSSEHAALGARVQALEKDNAKLSEDNVALVGHSNAKQKIQMHAKVLSPTASAAPDPPMHPPPAPTNAPAGPSPLIPAVKCDVPPPLAGRSRTRTTR